jgi:hypothetical protein
LAARIVAESSLGRSGPITTVEMSKRLVLKPGMRPHPSTALRSTSCSSAPRLAQFASVTSGSLPPHASSSAARAAAAAMRAAASAPAAAGDAE